MHETGFNNNKGFMTLPAASPDSSFQQLESIKACLDRFRLFLREQQQEHLLAEQAKTDGIDAFLQQFRKAWQGLDERQQVWEEENSPHFNIFRVLRVQRRETRLHTPFLADLLSPSGKHGQKFKFLNTFLEMLQKMPPTDLGVKPLKDWHPPQPPEKQQSSDWEVKPEIRTEEYGQTDITIRCPLNGGLFIVVENKVDAVEGDNQMCRYKALIQDRSKKYDYCSLVFLTPDGRPPVTVEPASCICLSYREHIRPWLEEVKSRVKALRLLETIEQYLETVKEL